MEDYFLERSAERDAARHEERLRAALTGYLRELVSEEAIIGGEERNLRVSYPVLRERRLRFADAGRGLLIEGPGNGSGAGDAPGENVLDWLREEIAQVLDRRWRLPDIAPPGGRGLQRNEAESLTRIGSWASLARRQSMLLALTRTRVQGAPLALRQEDLRFRSVRSQRAPAPDVRIVALRDVSGSMGDEKKQLCRSFFYWLTGFIRRSYGPLEIIYVIHHTEAQRVSEEEFFRRAESGGTKVSAAYRLAAEYGAESFGRGQQSIVLHFTDGDNWGDADNRLARDLVQGMLPMIGLFAYVEVRPHGRPSGLGSTLSEIADPSFRSLRVTDRQSVLGALDQLFSAEGA